MSKLPFIVVSVVVLVVAGLGLYAVVSPTPQNFKLGATPEESLLNGLNFWLEHEHGHTLVINQSLQEVADKVISEVPFGATTEQAEIIYQRIQDADNIHIAEDYLVSKGYRPAHVAELWGVGDVGTVSSNLIRSTPGGDTILKRGNVYTQAGIASTVVEGETVFFVILGS